ncbi:ferritin-like domain-containing protein [Niabella aurantiaca]|uniref:ferritin-like domain-containing protein n=1 Tax=Niabella aurantiaca TaxID=379900 RepID=UPI00035F5ED2|nr:ferritin-like domain-containing protein [Niabella aurantiaca]
MNLHQLFSSIEKADPDIYDRLSSRRKAIRSFSGIGGKLALAAVPLALGGLLNKAYGQSAPSDVTGVLQYALTLEYLEAAFYTKAVASGIIPAGAPAGALTTIRDHENQHVAFLTAVIKQLGATPVSKPAFDFTAGGHFANVFTNYDVLLAVAQTFEDTGVRAYKGQAGVLMTNNTVLTAALNIHSVEARHASHIRQMRRARTNDAAIKPWITGKNPGGINDDAVQKSYNGEEVTTQAGIDLTAFVSSNAASESFDEPLTYNDVIAIVQPFIKQ